MTIEQYQTLTGTTVPTSKQAKLLASLRKSERILEGLLGFTLDPDLYNENKYIESGKTSVACPCPSDTNTLTDPDAVVGAYRLFPYYRDDKYLLIDPATAIHKVKLVKDNVTYRTFEADEFRAEYENGIIKYLEVCDTCCCFNSCNTLCTCVQLAVDATWLWSDGNIPEDLLDLITEMGSYYSSAKKDIKSETLGSHSYTKFDNTAPERLDIGMKIISKYAGPLGSVKYTVT